MRGRNPPDGPAVDITFYPHFDLWNADPVVFRLVLPKSFPAEPPVVVSHSQWPEDKNVQNTFDSDLKMVSPDGTVNLYMCNVAGWLEEYPLEAVIYSIRMLLQLKDYPEDGAEVQPVGTIWPTFSPGTGIGMSFDEKDFGELSMSIVRHEEQGARPSMEDAMMLEVPLKCEHGAGERYSLFGVLDGHGGSAMSKYGADMLKSLVTSAISRGSMQGKSPNVRKILWDSLQQVDASWLATQRSSSVPDESGATACVVAVDTVEYKAYCANLGDSRAILCRGDRAVPLSYDQKPSKAREIAFICENGGFVSGERINGSIAVSRAIGDMYFKEKGYRYMSNEPDILEASLQPDDRFIVVACDGLFDVMTNEEVIAFIMMKKYDGIPSHEIVKILINHAINELGSTDNVSACIVDLTWDNKYDSVKRYSPPPVPANTQQFATRHRSRTRDRRRTKLFDQQKLKKLGVRNSAKLKASEKLKAVNELNATGHSMYSNGNVVHHIDALIKRSSAYGPGASPGSGDQAASNQTPVATDNTHGWTVHKDSKGREFYYNAVTQVSAWEKPEILKWAKAVTAEGKVYYYHTFTMETRWVLPSEDL
jgi:serine/threonine protein phosphatase PrpC